MNLIARLLPATRQSTAELPSQADLTHFESLLSSLLHMAWFVEARDPYTGGHLWRVSQYARLLAGRAGLDRAETTAVTIAGFLHDLGKISVPDGILNKPGTLTNQEYDLMKTHPQAGARLLAAHPLGNVALEGVLLHHERPDGRGYPHGYKREQIPVSALIIGICDAFDAMTSVRPYRRAMPIDFALSLMAEQSSSQFDEDLFELFNAEENRKQLAAIQGHSDAGIPLQYCPQCGPIVSVSRDRQPGDHVHCTNCLSDFILVDSPQARLAIRPTGKKARQEKLLPEPDRHVLGEIIRLAAKDLPHKELRQYSSPALH